jgi:predicted nucleic acid-binding protein
VRTLDALHLATADDLRSFRPEIQLATYDGRMAEVSRKMGLDLYPV